MKTEPLIRSMRRVYNKSLVGQMDRLLAEESRWKRKQTIASNKLAGVRKRINVFAAELAKDRTINPKLV